MEASRTFVGTIVCVDLVGYSKRSVAQQSEIKQAFNKLLMQAIKRVPPEDRIILDTGDGAAISFLGDPEESLAIGLKLRDAMNGAADKLGGAAEDAGPVRIGINLGPVRLAVDMNGHPKIIGDGINVAEKICSFAKPGQVVVSRPFHDMVSRISDQHREIFHYEGVRTDKNVREHEIYSVLPAAAAAPALALAAKAKAPAPMPAATPAAAAAAVASIPRGEGWIVRSLRDNRKVGATALVLLGVIGWELSRMAGGLGTSAGTEGVKPVESPSTSAPIAKVEPPPALTSPVKSPEIARTPELPKTAPPIETKMPEKKAPATEAKHAVMAPEKKAAPIETKPAEKAPEKKPAPIEPKPPEKKAAPVETKRAPELPRETPRKSEEPARVIPPPRTPPAQMAPAPSPAPSMQTTEPTPPIREEPKPAAPAAPAPPTTVATPISRVQANFPIAAINRGIQQGTVRARLSINAAGAVKDVTILASEPARVFDREAVRALETWRFNPGADNRSYEIEIEFKR